VVWRLYDRTDTIIHSTSGSFPANCSAPAAYDPADPNELTGPMPTAAGGLFSLGPNPKPPGWGLREYQNSCGMFDERGHVGSTYICSAALPGATMDSTWSDPAITGVVIRLLWSSVEYAPGRYDYYILDREVDKAIANGKLYSLTIEAGAHGTPSWLFTNGVAPLGFQDTGSNPDDPNACGAQMTLGAPWDTTYQQHYFDMLTAVATHLKARADRYRALAYVKPSGANLFTSENRLPDGCMAGCAICNDAIWSGAGYTPALLEGYYAAQLDAIAAAFPGKTMAYELIQDGFPRINAMSGYVDANGNLTAGPSQLGAFAQTNAIIADGEARYGDQFAVQHCGLHPMPAGACNGVASDPPGCPNRWVIDAGNAGQPTAFQTQNNSEIPDLPTLDSALQNAETNSDAAMIEVYEERLWEARQLPGALGPSGNTVTAWDLAFRQRRGISLSHSHTFTRTVAAGSQTLYYVNGTKCGDPGTPQWGSITIDP
jgi:hypothetical protein